MLKKIKNKKWCRIHHFNIAFFASIMWFWWLSLATTKFELVYSLNSNFSVYILYLSLILFIIVSILYILKIFINFKDVKSDFYHPVK